MSNGNTIKIRGIWYVIKDNVGAGLFVVRKVAR